MDSWPFVGASVETFWTWVVPTLTVSPVTLTCAGAPGALLVEEASGDCPPPLSAVVAGIVEVGWPEGAAEVVSLLTEAAAPAAPEMLVGGVVDLSVVMDACGWVETGLDVTVTVGVVTEVGFVDIVCISPFFLAALSVGAAVVVPPVVGMLLVVAANGVLPLLGTAVVIDVTAAVSFITDVALLEQTI